MSCIQCGTCSGTCPLSLYMDFTPRRIIALVREGFRRDVLGSQTIWLCASCYACAAHCPQDIHITDVMYTLKNMSLESKIYSNPTAPDFSKTFISMVERYGRSFEIGLAGIHSATHPRLAVRLPKMAPMALGMLIKKGMSPLPPRRIKGMDQLKKILKRAKELEAE